MDAPLMGTDHYIYRRDGKIYVRKIGAGDPVIFLHAVGLSGWTWGPVIDQFAREYTCYNIDLPGHDRSDIPPRKYFMEDYTDAITDVMDTIGLESTNIVADHTGTVLSLMLAGRHPDKVRRMVLDGLPYWNKEVGSVIWEKWFLPKYTDTSSYHIPVRPQWGWEDWQVDHPGLDRSVYEKMKEIHQRSRLWIRLSQEANSSYDVQEAAVKVKSPTLLLYGETDVLRRGEKRALEAIQGSVARIVSGSEGVVHQQKPDEFVSIAIDFLNQ
jgi:pimeloyl-ACP methyl ester carboxylesterase